MGRRENVSRPCKRRGPAQSRSPGSRRPHTDSGCPSAGTRRSRAFPAGREYRPAACSRPAETSRESRERKNRARLLRPPAVPHWCPWLRGPQSAHPPAPCAPWDSVRQDRTRMADVVASRSSEIVALQGGLLHFLNLVYGELYPNNSPKRILVVRKIIAGPCQDRLTDGVFLDFQSLLELLEEARCQGPPGWPGRRSSSVWLASRAHRPRCGFSSAWRPAVAHRRWSSRHQAQPPWARRLRTRRLTTTPDVPKAWCPRSHPTGRCQAPRA